MSEQTRIRAVASDGVTEVRMRMTHPMETGLRKGSDGEVIPAHYITELKVEHDGVVVLRADVGPALSENPYLAFRFQGGQPGDQLSVTWKDSEGEQRTDEAEIR